MTALQFDTRQPLIVIVGDFNPAIFSVEWIAKNLHGIPEGEEIQIVEMVAESPAGIAQLAFVNGVALAVSPSRIETFVLGHEKQRLDVLESTLVNLVNTLPHTPLRGIGCNFHYRVEEAAEDLLALFESPEGIEGEAVTRARQFMAQLEIDGALLNFTRAATATGNVQFSFNYHYSINNPAEYEELIPGMITKCRERSDALIESLYKLSDFDQVAFMPLNAEENGNGEGTHEHPLNEEHHH